MFVSCAGVLGDVGEHGEGLNMWSEIVEGVRGGVVIGRCVF